MTTWNTPSSGDGDGQDVGETTVPPAPPVAPTAPPEPTPAPSYVPSHEPITDEPSADEPSADEPSAATSVGAEIAAQLRSMAEVPDDPAPVEHSCRIIAIANQKGGVGKTTTTVNLSAALAEAGYRVLIVDLDPQANASTGLGLNPRALEKSMYDVILNDASIADCAEATAMKNLFVAPSSLDLAGAEIELVPAFNRERRLQNALTEAASDYDYIFIDCPPSLGLLTINALTAAAEVLVPIQCEYYALEGLGQLLRNVELVKKNLNPTLAVSTIVLVMYDARTKLAAQVAKEVRDHFGSVVCRQVIPRSVRLSEAPSFGQPIITFDSMSRGAIAYRGLAKEVANATA